MCSEVILTDDASITLREAGDFLASDPVLHNVILTLLHERLENPETGHYWIAKNGAEAVGVVAQSPTGLFANISRMTAEVAGKLATAIAAEGIGLPGINGEAAAAATFAGQLSERLNLPVMPVMGLRIYVLESIHDDSAVNGRLRQAAIHDREVVLNLMREFLSEIGESEVNLELMVERRLSAGRFWLWEDAGETVSLVGCSEAIEGIVRVRVVYTPEEKRSCGYGTAATRELSRLVRDRGSRCMLYTDLGNPISNSIYRRIGYRAVAEALRYRFG